MASAAERSTEGSEVLLRAEMSRPRATAASCSRRSDTDLLRSSGELISGGPNTLKVRFSVHIRSILIGVTRAFQLSRLLLISTLKELRQQRKIPLTLLLQHRRDLDRDCPEKITFNQVAACERHQQSTDPPERTRIIFGKIAAGRERQLPTCCCGPMKGPLSRRCSSAGCSALPLSYTDFARKLLAVAGLEPATFAASTLRHGRYESMVIHQQGHADEQHGHRQQRVASPDHGQNGKEQGNGDQDEKWGQHTR